MKNINKSIIMSLFVVLLSTGVFAAVEMTQANITTIGYLSTQTSYLLYFQAVTPNGSQCFFQPMWKDNLNDPDSVHYGFALPFNKLSNTTPEVHYGTADFRGVEYKSLYGINVMCNGKYGKLHPFFINDGTTAPVVTPMCDMTQEECDQRESVIEELNTQISTISADKQLLTDQLGECRETVAAKQQEISSLTSEIEGMSMLNEFVSYMTLAQKRSFMCDYMKNNEIKSLEQYGVKCDSTYLLKSNGRWTGSCKCKTTA